ncbi:MAG: FliH/SctL family protein [Polyangia bacterium]|nr:FliH/SctL family protein [Polyangia bacterium]
MSSMDEQREGETPLSPQGPAPPDHARFSPEVAPASRSAQDSLPRLRVLLARETLPRAVVIKRDRVEALDLAERAIARAKDEAAALMGAAKEEAVRLGEKAREEGRREGLRSLALGEAALRAEAVRLRAEAGDRLLRLAVALAGEVLGQELRTQPEALLALVRKAIAQVSFCSRAVVRLHPDDARALATAYPALHEAVRGGEELSLVEDPELERGDCLVEAAGGRVDGSARVLLSSLEQALRSGAAPETLLPPVPEETRP